MPTLLAIDVSNWIFRIFHATAATITDGRLLPFARARVRKSLESLIRDTEPLRLVAAFDAPGGSFRDQLLPEYKAHRGKKPQEIKDLLSEAPEIFLSLGFECLVAEHYEADDVLATVADQCLATGGWRVLLVTNDGDLASTVYDNGDGTGVFLYKSVQGAYQLWGPEQVMQKYGVPPSRLSFLKSIQGDSSDGYPGIPGLGPVAGKRLATQFPNANRLYDALEGGVGFPAAERAKLEACGRAQALLMERVARLVRQAPVQRLTPDGTVGVPDPAASVSACPREP